MTNRKPPQGKPAVLDIDGLVLSNRFVIDHTLTRRPLVSTYLAWELQTSQPVILEILDESLVHDPELMPHLRKEAERSVDLEHDNILAFRGLYESDQGVFAIRDYVDGVTLMDFMVQAGGPLPLYEVIQVVDQAAQGLHYAHRAGILNRSVNPRNIWLRYDGRVLLAGFGLPSLAGIGSEAEVDPAYLSPEQCSGQKIDQRADLYALAAVCFRMGTGHPLFTGVGPDAPGASDWERICWEHVNVPAPFASKLNSDLPRDVGWAISRGLAKRPDERYRSVLEFAATMKRAVTEAGLDPDAMLAEPAHWRRDPHPITPPSTPAKKARAQESGGAHWNWLIGLLLAVVAIWGVLVFLILNSNQEPALTGTIPTRNEPVRSGGQLDALATWTPPVIARPTDTRVAVRLAPPEPTQRPSVPGDLPYAALKPLTDQFDWDAYMRQVTWRSYTDPRFGYALIHPAGWSLEQGDNVMRLYMPERDAAVIVCSCGTRVADSGQWATRFLELLRRDFGDVRQLDQRRYNDYWLSTLAQVPKGGDDIQIAVLSSGKNQGGYDVAFIAWATDWQGIKPIFDRMARELRFP